MSEQKEPTSISCPPKVQRLVENFHNHIETYRSGQYNEAELRQEFINPLFEALGWDISNTANIADAYKDVIHEDAVKIGGATKAGSTPLIVRSISWCMSCTD